MKSSYQTYYFTTLIPSSYSHLLITSGFFKPQNNLKMSSYQFLISGASEAQQQKGRKKSINKTKMRLPELPELLIKHLKKMLHLLGHVCLFFKHGIKHLLRLKHHF